MERYGSVYLVTNTVTQEQYVGQTRQKVKRRWNCHVNTANSNVTKKYRLSQAILAHGREVFSFTEVYTAFDAAALNAFEIACIAELNPSYNITKGGAGHRGVSPSQQVRRNTSIRVKALWADPEWRRVNVEKNKAACQTPEARERGMALQRFNGGAVRWAGHVKKVKLAPRVRKVKVSRAPEIGRDIAARAKWKPVLCPELKISFLCQKYAAEYLGVLHTSVSMAVKRKGKVCGQYTLVRVT